MSAKTVTSQKSCKVSIVPAAEVFEIVEFTPPNCDCFIGYDNQATEFFSFIKTIKKLTIKISKFVGQAKRNFANTVSDSVSIICLLIKSTQQNYRIDRALETMSTMT